MVLALVLAVPGLALAASRPDDPQSAFVLDLRPAGGDTYHVHVGDSSLWENANRLAGLQTRPVGAVDPDAPLTP